MTGPRVWEAVCMWPGKQAVEREPAVGSERATLPTKVTVGSGRMWHRVVS